MKHPIDAWSGVARDYEIDLISRRKYFIRSCFLSAILLNFHRGHFLIFRMRFVSAAGQLAGAWQRLGCGASRGARQCGGARSSGPGEGPKSLPPCVYGRRCTTYHLTVQSSCRPPSRAPSYTPTSDPLRNQQ